MEENSQKDAFEKFWESFLSVDVSKIYAGRALSGDQISKTVSYGKKEAEEQSRAKIELEVEDLNNQLDGEDNKPKSGWHAWLRWLF